MRKLRVLDLFSLVQDQGCTILPSRGLGQKLIHRNRSICEVFPWRK